MKSLLTTTLLIFSISNAVYGQTPETYKQKATEHVEDVIKDEKASIKVVLEKMLDQVSLLVETKIKVCNSLGEKASKTNDESVNTMHLACMKELRELRKQRAQLQDQISRLLSKPTP